MSDQAKDKKTLFHGRMRLYATSKKDIAVHEKVQQYMKDNNIKTFMGAVKDMIFKKELEAEPIQHVHYWIPVNKDDIPENIYQPKDK